jgi:hypothetical protein
MKISSKLNPLLFLTVVTCVMTSLLMSDVASAPAINVDCVLCHSRCELEKCVCQNDCIRGSGNDCKRLNVNNLIGKARTCVHLCDREFESCERSVCEKPCGAVDNTIVGS